jgi:hypothetical protein
VTEEEMIQQHQPRKNGQLQFFRTELVREISVFWKLEHGELGKGKTWVVSISFSENFGISLEISKLIFDCLTDPSMRLKFKTENFESDCIIYDISEFADTNVIDIGSPNLPMARMTINKPKNQ